jgi:5-formyltetrahydrofolate cyclo-ligase
MLLLNELGHPRAACTEMARDDRAAELDLVCVPLLGFDRARQPPRAGRRLL